MRGVILGVHVLLALGIIGLVLLQRGKGADAGAGFGAGASGTVFGARGTSTLFSKMTAWFAAAFFCTSLGLAYLGTHQAAAPNSILERAARQSSVAPPSKAPPPALSPAATPEQAPAIAPAPAPAPEKK